MEKIFKDISMLISSTLVIPQRHGIEAENRRSHYLPSITQIIITAKTKEGVVLC